MPKRSAGCFECRKRKVRCDEGRPECNTCLRRGTKCPGYRPTQSFILHTFDESTERPGVIREDEDRYRFANQQSASPENTRAVVQLRPSDERPVDAPVPKQVSPAAIDRVQYLSNFLALYLPRWEGQLLTPPTALMLALPNIPASRQVLLSALDALSLAQLTVNYKNYPLMNRTRSYYGAALGQMMRAIVEPGSPEEDQILLSSYLLTLYEVFVGVTNGHGFFYHVQGLLRILKQRGPGSIKTKLAMDTFHGIRYNSLSIGYHMRKASMLDTPEWLAVTSKATKVDPYVALIDIVIHFPRILERTDKLTRTNASAPEFEEVIRDSQSLADQGMAWFDDFCKPSPPYTEVPVETTDGYFAKDDKTFDPVFRYKSFAASNMCSIYWMSMLIMRSNAFQLVRKHRTLEPKQLYMWDRELSGYADSICRGVPFSCRPAAGYVGRFGQLTPLVVARKYFTAKGATKEVAWCEKIYYGARIPGLYSPPIPIEPLKGLAAFVQNSERYI